MTDRKTKDYYQKLGIEPKASSDEIRSAYRKLAVKFHPDKAREGDPLDKDERVARMTEINEAHGVLSNNEKRAKYDEERRREGARRGREGSYSGAGSFQDFFGSADIFGSAEGGLWGTTTKTKTESFLIPENDWALLAALKMAYESKTDGKWLVKKSEKDKRDFVAEVLYSVKRDGDMVIIYRNIDDWRDKRDRGKDIEIKKEGGYLGDWETGEVLKSTSRVHEYYLSGEGRNRLRDWYCIPNDLGNYFQAMKSLARKFALHETDGTGNYDVQQEQRIINGYSLRARHLRTEGGVFAGDEEKEKVREVDFANFWEKMRESEELVKQVEGQVKSKEGQMGGGGEKKG